MKALPHHFWFPKLLDSLLHIRNENLWHLSLVESSPFVVVQSLIYVSLWPHALQLARLPCPSLSPRSFSNSCPLSLWCHLTNLILCHFLLLLPSIFPSIRVFSNESGLHTRWPDYCNFSFSVSPSNEHSELISSKIDWSDLLAVHGTLSSSTIVWKIQFFSSQPSLWSNSHICTWLLKNNITLTR